MSNQQPPAPVTRLEHIQFMPNVSVPAGMASVTTLSGCWRLDKHAEVKPVEQKNGDIWLYHPNGRISELRPWMVAYVVRGPEQVKK